MANKGNQPGRGGHGARSRLNDSEQLLDRKRRQQSTGLVEIPGPLSAAQEEQVRNTARSVERSDQQRYPDSELSSIMPFDRGLAIETNSEKLAQHIADALARSTQAEVIRTFDDEGRRRILTCRLPNREG